MNASGTPPIVDEVEAVRHAARSAPPARATYSACAPPPTMPNTRSPTVERRVTSAPSRVDDARELEAGDVGRRRRAAPGSRRRAA